MELLQDAHRFLMYYKGPIESYPLQSYASALLFSPTESAIRKLFENEPAGTVVKPATNSSWIACLLTLEGHSSSVRSVAFSHNSSKLASASCDNTVKLWDVSSGECLQTFTGHSDTVNAVAFSHKLSKLASASHDNTVKLWDVSSGECLQTFTDHSSPIRSVAFSHDSSKLASASQDKTVKVWDASSGECLHTFTGHSSDVISVAFSHDSSKLASASYDKTVKVWDASSGECLQTLSFRTTIRNLSFDSSASCLHTEAGTIVIYVSQTSDRATATGAEYPLYLGTSLSSDNTWIKHAGKNMLWIPSEYRPSRSTVHENTVAMGVGSGRIWTCSIDRTHL
jgi:WD40 repeat protein